MNMSDILKLKLTKENFLNKILLQDDGNGAYIKEWNISDMPRPTRATLDKWELEVAEQYELEQIILSRQKEYMKEGATTDALIVALWEKLVEGRPEAADALQVKRQTIKSAHPKPESK